MRRSSGSSSPLTDHAHTARERAREKGWPKKVEPEARAAAVVELGLEIGAPGPRADGHAAVHGAFDGQQLTGPQVGDAHEAARVEPGARVVAHQVLERGQLEPREGLGATAGPRPAGTGAARRARAAASPGPGPRAEDGGGMVDALSHIRGGLRNHPAPGPAESCHEAAPPGRTGLRRGRDLDEGGSHRLSRLDTAPATPIQAATSAASRASEAGARPARPPCP